MALNIVKHAYIKAESFFNSVLFVAHISQIIHAISTAVATHTRNICSRRGASGGDHAPG